VSREDLPTPPVGHPSEEGILLTCWWGMGILIVRTNILTSAAPAMSYCINPACPAPDKNSPTTNFCMSCGAKILLKDRYRALKLLGQGGFGKTFKAVDEDQPRKPLCVIKQFAFSNNHPETRQIALKLFYEEAQHLEALGKHDQIPELLAYFDVEGQPYLVQQFIDGQDLEQELATAGTFNQSKIRELLESLLPVLDFLHHQSPPVIHRDIKPANIIRRRGDGGFVLVDFGAAKQATQSMLAKTGTAIGSAEFTAPEQARRKPVFASDIYSLGVTCIYLLTQVSPFDLFDMNQDAWVWRNYLLNNPVGLELSNMLDKMIANSFFQRYQSAAEVLGILCKNHACENVICNENFATPALSAIKPVVFISQPVLAQLTKQKFTFQTAKVELTGKTNWSERTKITRIAGEAESIIQDLANGVKLEMVYIPAGNFIMGCDDISKKNIRRQEAEQPIHQVNLSPFYIGKYPVTQLQYEDIMGVNPSHHKWNKNNDPVTNVRWNDSMKFCEKLSQLTGYRYSLPSESQWEYACRAGTTTHFYFGDEFTRDLANCNHIYGDSTTPVGNFPPNAFGLYDMHGNVWEWCLDIWHENYNGAPTDGSAWIENGSCPDGGFQHDKLPYHVRRGGAFWVWPHDCRCSTRSSSFFKELNTGFRVVCSPSF
jgi:formylglycine-generating enzyme required for sulfatase activity